MALADAVQGARRPSQSVTWYREGTSTPEDLTGATLTGQIRRGGETGALYAITGTLTVTDGEAGEFRWDYSAADVAAAGEVEVQFTATFGSGQTPAKTFIADWCVRGAFS